MVVSGQIESVAVLPFVTVAVLTPWVLGVLTVLRPRLALQPPFRVAAVLSYTFV
jgi:hypothetical protein